MKAIILTWAKVSDNDVQLLINTNIHKFAINQHAEYLKPDFRICSDFGVIANLLNNFSQNVITVRDYVPNDRIIYAGHIPFKGSTMIACIEYLLSKGYTQILIVGDNTVHQKTFQNRINHELKIILNEKSDIKIFQYSNGNFDLPAMSISQFII